LAKSAISESLSQPARRAASAIINFLNWRLVKPSLGWLIKYTGLGGIIRESNSDFLIAQTGFV
jgi:hypothetical protein